MASGWYVSTRGPAGLGQPFDVVCDPVTGDAYVAQNTSYHRLLKIAPAGTMTIIAGGVGGFAGPCGLDLDPQGVS